MLEERSIELARYWIPEESATFLVKRELFLPRTPQAYEIKSFVYLDLGGRHKASLLTRKVELFCLPTLLGFEFEKELDFADKHILAWEILRDRGFSVVPSVRKVDRETVATTNLVADEITSIYDQKIDAIVERDTQAMDGEFVKIPTGKIAEKADVLLNLADKSGVELMSDGPFHILVKPDGRWDLIVLDIGKVRIHSRPKDLPPDAKKDNLYYVNKALREFASIQRNIKALRDARGLP